MGLDRVNTCILSRVVDGYLSYPSSKAERVGMNFSNSIYFMVCKLSKLATIKETLLSKEDPSDPCYCS